MWEAAELHAASAGFTPGMTGWAVSKLKSELRVERSEVSTQAVSHCHRDYRILPGARRPLPCASMCL